MYQEILNKKAELDRRKPLAFEIRSAISRATRMDMLYGELLLAGTNLMKSDVEAMLEGQLVGAASLKEYTFTQRYEQVLDMAKDWLELGNQIDKKFLLKVHRLLTERPSQFRRSNLPVQRYGYVPVHQSAVEEQLSILLREVYRKGANPIKTAAHLHCEIMRIYPVDEYNETIARLAMNFYLAENGFLPVWIGYGYHEYIETMKVCLQQKENDPFFRGLERAVYNKLDAALQIAEDLSSDV